MKSLKYILLFCLFALFGLHHAAKAQSTLSHTAPGSTIFVGSIASISYTHHFPTNAGEYIRIELSYNASHFSFNNSTLITQSNGLYTDVTVLPPPKAFESQVFTANDNGFFTDVEFSMVLDVVAANCIASTQDVTLKAMRMSATGTVLETDISTAQIQIQNQQNTPTASIEFMEGGSCGFAMYKIKTFGKESSNIDLLLPPGVTLTNVYNTSGNVVSFTGANPYNWARSATTGDYQEHYIMVSFAQPFSCANQPKIKVDFHTHPCGSTSNVTIPAEYAITCADCTAQPASKVLYPYPLRYFPEPNNCRPHTYVIEFKNVSAVPLTVFSLKDFFSGINTTPNEISILSIKLSMTSLIPNSPPPVFSWVSSAFPGATLSGTLPGNSVVFQGSPEVLSGPSPTGIGTWTLSAAQGATFPPFSSLKVTVVHRLKDFPTGLGSPQYNNKVQIHYKKNGILMSAHANVESDMQPYQPVITIKKQVRNASTGTPFSSSVAAGPNDVIQFRIKIRNEGMNSLFGVQLQDLISELPVGNIILPYSVTVTGTPEYSLAAKNAIRNAIVASASLTGFSAGPFTVEDAPCLGASELVIKYLVRVKNPTQVFCNSDYTNKVKLSHNNVAIDSSEARVNIDLFRNISYTLEATCDSTQGWSTNNINAVPGRIIYYRGRVKNNNNYPVTMRIMIQLPNGLPADNLSTHTSLPTNIVMSSAKPAGPDFIILGNVTPATVRRNQVNVPGLTNDWLGTNLPSPATSATSKALYYIVTLPAGGQAVIRYKISAPVNNFGSVYNTAMGVTLASNTANNNNCPRVKQANLALTVSQGDLCGSVSGCQLIFFDKKIEKLTGNNYKVTLFNILNLSSHTINFMDVVLGQPYKNCMNSTSTPPYIKTMLPFTIASTVSSTGGQFVSGPVALGQRYYHLTNTSPSTPFGEVSFIVSIPTVPPSPGCGILFPVNIVFKDNQKACTICETTIYLSSVLSSGLPG